MMFSRTDDEARVLQVRDLLSRWLKEIRFPGFRFTDDAGDCLGKLLRTRLAACVLGGPRRKWPAGIEYTCAAVELVHTASLFHDDVVDGASLRRGRPSLWRLYSRNGAVLIGDILFSEAISRLAVSPGRRHLNALLDKGREVCLTESEQEMNLRSVRCDMKTCLRIARGKTGPLFALTAMACAGKDRALARALEEAGYLAGTAYQLADDLVDETGDESAAGKTLGTDRLRRKFTLARENASRPERLPGLIRRICGDSLRLLNRWPARQAGLRRFFDQYLLPASVGGFPATEARLPPGDEKPEQACEAAG